MLSRGSPAELIAQRDGEVMAESEGRALAWTVLAPVLAAAVPALLGAVGLWFREWRNHRNDSVRQRRAVESAHLYVRYLSDWFVAYEKAHPDKELTQARDWATRVLDDQLDHVLAARPEYAEEHATGVRFGRILRRMLLLFPLRSVWGVLLRYAYLFALLLVCLFVSFLLVQSGESWGVRVGSAAVVLVPACGILYGLWALTVHLSPGRSEPGK
jgi:hypothetical protein